MSAKSSGRLTFLFTDIEGSTVLLEDMGDAGYARVLTEHLRLLRAAFRREGGKELGTQGDGMLVSFPRPDRAVAAAIAAQQAIVNNAWPDGVVPRVRIGIHTGEVIPRAGEHIGLDLHRAARICQASHGGQILVSATTSELIGGSLPAEVRLRSLGSHRLRNLQQPEQIFQIVHPTLPDRFPPLRSLDAFPNNLPRQVTSFIGRERELGEVRRLLSSTSLLMLTGAGGCGKTRLALQTAADLVETFADGVWFVELAALTDPTLVLATVASALGVRKASTRTLHDTVLDFLRPRELLLVLDNCEHLLTGVAGLVEALIRNCPHLHVLATSREPLDIPGEMIWRVPSLSLPRLDERPTVELLMRHEATRLFVERALANQPGFAPNLGNAAAIIEICRRLDGIPLAIELAAARMRALSVTEIAARLDERFNLLTGGSRTALARQQTLRGALDWSHDLLSEKERILLRRLAVFAGEWTLEAAEAVTSDDGMAATDVLDLSAQLVFKSLVLMDTYGEQARYHMLETVRQYGQTRLDEAGEASAVRTRHMRWYLRLVEGAEPEMIGPTQSVWLHRLEEERDNLRGALEWALLDDASGDAGLRLAKGLYLFWYVRGDYVEGRRWLATALSTRREVPLELRAAALVRTGFLACRLGDYEDALAQCTEGLALFRHAGDWPATGYALTALGMILAYRRDFERAKAALSESVDIGRRFKRTRDVATSLNSLGEIARCRDNLDEALVSYEESLTLFRSVGDVRGIATATGNLGHVALRRGDHERAAKLFREALGYAKLAVHNLGIAEHLAGLGGVSVVTGEHARAVRLLGAAKSLLDKLGAALFIPDQSEYDRSLLASRGRLDAGTLERAWAEGQAMTVDQAIEYALKIETRQERGECSGIYAV